MARRASIEQAAQVKASAPGTRQATCLRRQGAARSPTFRQTRAARRFKRAFKGRMTQADIDRWCTTPSRLAREAGGRAPRHPVRGTVGNRVPVVVSGVPFETGPELGEIALIVGRDGEASDAREVSVVHWA